MTQSTSPADHPTLAQLADMVGGRLVGDGNVICQGANPPMEACDGEITLLDDPQRTELIGTSKAIAVVTQAVVDLPLAQIVVSNPHLAFGQIVERFRPALNPKRVDDLLPASGVHPSASIAASASIHPSAIVGAGSVIGERTLVMPGAIVMPNCRIGKDCILHGNVTLYEYSALADRVVVHAGSVIGAHGFGYRQESGRHIPTSQLGYVEIESDVEIGACVTIDRGTYGVTRIGEGTKIDNQVQIAHNCIVGKHNLLCSQVGIAGSCRTGDYVILAGQVGLKDHISLGDHAVIAAQAGVMDDLPGHEVYFGSPATTHKKQMQILAVERRLPELRREVKRLRRELDDLKQAESVQESPKRAA